MLTRLFWRGEPIIDVHAFCREKGFNVCRIRQRERHHRIMGPELWGPWSEWAESEAPEPMAKNILDLRTVGGQMEAQHEVLETYPPNKEDDHAQAPV